MKAAPVSRSGSLRRASGVLCLSMAALLAVASTGRTLQANQEPTSGPVGLTAERPSVISGEAIEVLDKALVEALNPLLGTLFDSARSTEQRRAAATALKSTIATIPSKPATSDELKRKLERIVALMDAALAALQVDSTDQANAAQSNVTVAAVKVKNYLAGINNGNAWLGYVFANELASGSATTEIMTQAHANLTVMKDLTIEQKNFLRKPAFQELSAAIDSALASGLFADDVAKAKADRAERVNALVVSLFEYELEPVETQAEKARSAWRTLRARYPSTANALRHTVNSQYFNHNVHVTISETLLSRLISDYRSESGCIADCVLGAWVTGSQTTDVNVNVDVLPSTHTASFDLKLSGNTRSNTKAVKDPATVWTNGNHYFWMNRHVSFDGRHVYASPATFAVDTNSRTVGLATKFDGIPIFGGIVRNIAKKKIAESKPQSEAITANKMRDKAVPEFERETDQQFADGNSTISKTLDSLEKRGVAPDSISARSSNTHVAFSTRTIGTGRLGGSLQPPSALMATGLSAQLHQSALNNSIDALGFQGKVVAEKDFVTEIEKALTELLQRDIKLTDGKPSPPPAGEEPEPETFFVFGEQDPIRVEFQNGRIIVILRTGIRQAGKEDIPQQTIRIPIVMTVENGKVILDPESSKFSIKGPGAARKPQIKRILDRRIVRKELNSTIDLQAAGDKTLPLTISFIELNDGWLTIEAQ